MYNAGSCAYFMQNKIIPSAEWVVWVASRVGLHRRPGKNPLCDIGEKIEKTPNQLTGIAEWTFQSAMHNCNNVCDKMCDCGKIHKFNLSDFIKSIRGTFSRKIHEGQIWQARFYDKIIDNDNSLWATVNYISNNPIKAGLPKKWRKYPYQFKAHKLING